MKLMKEINLTPEAEADVALFRKTFPSSRLILFKVKAGADEWCLTDDLCVIGIGNNIDSEFKDKEDLSAYTVISEASWKRAAPFHGRIERIEKANNRPFLLYLKSGLVLSIAPYIKDEVKQ